MTLLLVGNGQCMKALPLPVFLLLPIKLFLLSSKPRGLIMALTISLSPMSSVKIHFAESVMTTLKP